MVTETVKVGLIGQPLESNDVDAISVSRFLSYVMCANVVL